MTARSRVHIFVLIDALGWACLEKQDFLQDLLPFRQPLRTILGFSSGAIPTILTGEPPARNGHWNLFYYDPGGSPFRWLRHFRFLPAGVLDNRYTRKALKELGRHVLGLGPLFECCVSPSLLPWFNWVEKRSIYGPNGIIGARSIFDRLSEEGVPYRAYSYHEFNDSEILLRASEDLLAKRANFFFLYLSELDHFLHFHCEDHDQVAQRLAWYGRSLRSLFELAREIDPAASFTVFSDHGMTPVRKQHDVAGAVERLGLRMPEDYLSVYDSTMARFWFFREEARRQVIECLRAQPCGRLLSDEELAGMGTLFADRRFGELVYLLDPGSLISRSDFNGVGWAPKAMHGYHPDDPYSDAIFLTNREPRVPMHSIVDIYPHLEAGLESAQ
jgi:hypothetical protein